MNDKFFPTTVDVERFNEDMARPAARKKYMIFFTARSGSSWLTDICKRSKRLSFPDEALNPSFIPKMAVALNARNMTEYFDILCRRRNARGVYGAQITYHQLNAVFDSEDEFMSYFSDWKMVWLLREDIVLQGLSLLKMQQTQVAHQPHSSAEEIGTAESKFVYNNREIKKWIQHNFQAERDTEAMFARYGIDPLRLSYEGITRAGAHQTVNALAHYLDIPPVPDENLDSDHAKIGTSKNNEFAERFRRKNASFIRSLEKARAPWLARVDRTPPTGL